MPTILGLIGFNATSTSDDKLFAVHDRNITDIITGTSQAQPLKNTLNRAEFAVFLDRVWFVNGTDDSRYYTAGGSWTKTGAAARYPVAKYIQQFKTRLFIGNLTILGTNYPSRVWYSDLPKNNTITWGFEAQTNLQQAAGSAIVKSPGAQFITYNIKAGDAFIILTGANAGEYKVSTIDSETQITLTTNLTYSDPADSYIAGGNWFDVATDDNDSIVGFGENSDRLLIFKNESLWRYDGVSVKQVKGVPGTTTQRSVVNVREFTFYFHYSGIYLYDGITSYLISRQVQDYIDGVSSGEYSSIVAWKVGTDTYRCYLKDVVNADAEINIPKCYLDYDLSTKSWSVGKYPKHATVSSTYLETLNTVRNTYLGTEPAVISDAGQVFKDNDGNNDGSSTTPIEWNFETIWHFPFGSTIYGDFTRVDIHTKRGRGINVLYKLYNEVPSKDWIPLGDIENTITSFDFQPSKPDSGRGIKFLFNESSTNKPPIIEKIVCYGIPKTDRPVV